MIGTRTTATQVMTLSVSWLEVASHIVTFAFIMVLDSIAKTGTLRYRLSG